MVCARVCGVTTDHSWVIVQDSRSNRVGRVVERDGEVTLAVISLFL